MVIKPKKKIFKKNRFKIAMEIAAEFEKGEGVTRKAIKKFTKLMGRKDYES